jgi:hypothetical protein
MSTSKGGGQTALGFVLEFGAESIGTKKGEMRGGKGPKASKGGQMEKLEMER